MFDGTSWTGKLWNLVLEKCTIEGRTGSTLSINLELMGPYGTSFVRNRKEEFSHALSIGTSTGIFPIMSRFNQHARQLTRRDPTYYYDSIR